MGDKMIRQMLMGFLVALSLTNVAAAQADNENFSSHKAITINNATQSITLSDFNFGNKYYQSSTRLFTNLRWTNSGAKGITAFEVVILYFDPFNQPIGAGGRWMIPGHDSANWAPLQPGQSDSDGLIGFSDEKVYTAIAYVRAIRFEDGTVWYSNQTDVAARVRAAIPTLSELPSLDPGPKVEKH
jgi:hypothetical protein